MTHPALRTITWYLVCTAVKRGEADTCGMLGATFCRRRISFSFWNPSFFESSLTRLDCAELLFFPPPKSSRDRDAPVVVRAAGDHGTIDFAVACGVVNTKLVSY